MLAQLLAAAAETRTHSAATCPQASEELQAFFAAVPSP